MQQSIVKPTALSHRRCSTCFGHYHAHHQEPFQTAVAVSDFRTNAEADVLPATAGSTCDQFCGLRKIVVAWLICRMCSNMFAGLGLLITYLERPNRIVMAVIYNVGQSIADHVSWDAETYRIRSCVVGCFGLDSVPPHRRRCSGTLFWDPGVDSLMIIGKGGRLSSSGGAPDLRVIGVGQPVIFSADLCRRFHEINRPN
jgi:hypothetical protein